MALGLRGSKGVAAAPFTAGPYIWDQFVTFSAGMAGANTKGNIQYVDGTNGSDGSTGTSWTEAKATIQAAVTAAGAYGIVYVAPKAMAAGASDPGSYAETIIIPATHECLSIVGIGNRTQGGLPQIKKGSGTTALLTIRAAGCTIANLGFNGIWTADSTQSLIGILLDDDSGVPSGSGGETKSAFGTTITNCHFKNCAGSTASTNAAAGGAITWAATGGAFQVHIVGNRFYKNVGDIVLLGTTGSVPQDVVIEDNVFSGPAANVDCNLYLAGGSGMNGVIIRNNLFTARPNISSGTNTNFLVLTSCVGVLAENFFACTGITFGATANETVPTTMLMCGNWQEIVIGNDNYQGTTVNRT